MPTAGMKDNMRILPILFNLEIFVVPVINRVTPFFVAFVIYNACDEKRESPMHSLNGTALERNKKIKKYFNGGDLFSDAGLFLLKEFIDKTGIDRIVNRKFHTNDDAKYKFHTDGENLLPSINSIRTVFVHK